MKIIKITKLEIVGLGFSSRTGSRLSFHFFKDEKRTTKTERKKTKNKPAQEKQEINKKKEDRKTKRQKKRKKERLQGK